MFHAFKICVLFNICCFSVYAATLGEKKKDLIVDFMSENNFIHTKKEMNCDSDLYKIYCRNKCEEKRKTLGICLEGNCYCVMDEEPELLPLAKPKYQDLIKREPPKLFTESEEEPPMLSHDLLKKPALRHQIAHFCPNLDIARKCVRKCSARGKPAFCGKDHICYCGHKYESTKKEDSPDVLDKYKNFKDLYDKYFPNYTGILNNTDSKIDKHVKNSGSNKGVINNKSKIHKDVINSNEKINFATTKKTYIKHKTTTENDELIEVLDT